MSKLEILIIQLIRMLGQGQHRHEFYVVREELLIVLNELLVTINEERKAHIKDVIDVNEKLNNQGE